MTDKLTILVATMSGTGELVAEEIVERIEDRDGEARIVRMEKSSPAAIAKLTLAIICSSSYGAGEIPDNGKELFDALSAQRPDLSALRYGVIGLGDSEYAQTFCFGAKKFDELFTALGATRVGERLEFDTRSGGFPEEAAGAWADAWLDLVQD